MTHDLSHARTREEAKAAVQKAEDAWRRTFNAWSRLFRERFRAQGEATGAEREAEAALARARVALDSARKRWQVIIATVPTQRPRGRRWSEPDDDDGETGSG